MNHLLPFIHDNLFLVIPFIIVLIAYLTLEMRHRDASNFTLSAQLTVLKMNQKNCQILDLRSPEAFQQGHIVNAKPYDAAAINALPQHLQKHKSNPIVLICQAGTKAQQAAALLKKQKFEQVFVLENGMNGWKKAGMPTVSGSK